MKTLKTIVYWFIQCTWGCICTTLGFLVFICTCWFTEKRIYKGAVVSYIGHNWGGVNLGPFVFIYEEAKNYWVEDRRINEHEWGHSIQNLFWGPLQLFVIDIPSAVRYWYREFLQQYYWEKYINLPPYDAIWFEGQATAIGEKYRVEDSYWKN